MNVNSQARRSKALDVTLSDDTVDFFDRSHVKMLLVRTNLYGLSSVSAMPHNVLICEDNLDLLDDFSSLLRSDPRLTLLGAVSSGKEAIHILQTAPVDVLIVDLGLPDISGLDVLRSMRGWQPRCEGLVVTVFGDEETVTRAIEAGATGYVLKSEASFNLLRRIEELLAGGSPITPSIARLVLSRMRERPSDQANNEIALASTVVRKQNEQYVIENPNDDRELSEREIEVLQLIAKGLSIQEVGELLALSANTVKTYVRRIYKKLAVNSRIEAIYEARAMGILDPRASSG
jgi:DNA-binding NarL/FixJ family response regulator